MEATDPLKQKLDASELGAHVRPTWLPILEAGDAEPTASKFGGTPYLAPNEAWPVCPHCSEPMSLVLQLELGSLPAELGNRLGAGLLQFFYCTNGDPLCEVETEAYFAGPSAKGRSKLVRVVQIQPSTGTATSVTPPRPLTPQRITGWTARIEPPPAVELAHRGLEYDAMLDAAGIDEDDYIDAIEIDDKLGGWPAWIQNVEYPKCPECSRDMDEFVFQVASGENVDCGFCGDGVAYLVQCPEHRSRVDGLAQR